MFLKSARIFSRINFRHFYLVFRVFRQNFRLAKNDFQEGELLQELVLERVVEPSVNERVAAGGNHRRHVTNHEERVVVLEAVHVEHVQVGHQVDDVEREPGEEVIKLSFVVDVTDAPVKYVCPWPVSMLDR
jgi:hypothetical protein